MTNARRSSPLLALLCAALAPLVASAQEPKLRSVEPSALRSVPAETTAAARVDKNWRVPRTSWGHPSLEGVWSTDDLRGVPMNRPAKLGLRETLTPEEFAARARGDESVRDFDVNVGTFLQHESGIRSFGYSSLVIDPPNGQTPTLT
ncbi:MAG TPA: hypothetical protein VMU03_17360, partial [Gammaproteobacteria bacterium]|nr:hypothetical protein [Gammaproteobacteria bacterium]